MGEKKRKNRINLKIFMLHLRSEKSKKYNYSKISLRDGNKKIS